MIVNFEQKEYLRKVYMKSYRSKKIAFLCDYYKYHKEIPRIFI
jgi:hypothetical protein